MEDTITNFKQFLRKNFDLVKNTQFTPKNVSKNEYRHIGIKHNKMFTIYLEEVFYLFTMDINILKNLLYHYKLVDYEVYFLIYYRLKNAGFNLMRHHEGYQIYVKNSDFNRKTSESIGIVKIVDKHKKPVYSPSNVVYAVCCGNFFTFLKQSHTSKLNFRYTNAYKLNKTTKTKNDKEFFNN
ncbi:hypothetical protein EDEG_00825 [Edhazardia aedis USNM 41457]|uniref:tRNA intron endonuclease catalytic domain-containing protein n=1 Tax=Edhazardia aedis (strain USNM 41457) TaxID=1003232 RepID=J9DC45_EDHAE|nr:hypothetical protein EDEG_00825 [Edhazardia aedis USNM 41457]|eukprot:EJW05044.1 hypothetical protein EDEG_00825 [Edhazardia aedis USNM 41457]